MSIKEDQGTLSTFSSRSWQKWWNIWLQLMNNATVFHIWVNFYRSEIWLPKSVRICHKIPPSHQSQQLYIPLPHLICMIKQHSFTPGKSTWSTWCSVDNSVPITLMHTGVMLCTSIFASALSGIGTKLSSFRVTIRQRWTLESPGLIFHLVFEVDRAGCLLQQLSVL